MGTARTPAGTRIFMQSAISSKQQVTGISKTDPGVVTYTGVDPTNGNYIALVDMFGMTEFEGALVKAANVNGAGNTFETEDQNSTNYGAFVSGNMQVVTLATEIGDATGFRITGFEQQYAEYNLLRDRITRRKATVVSAGSVELPMLWDPTDATMQAIVNAATSGADIGFKVLFPDGLEMLFFGSIGASGLPTVENNQSIIQSSVVINMATRPRYVLP